MPESSLRPPPISLCFKMLGLRLPSGKGIAADNTKFHRFYAPIGEIRVICGFFSWGGRASGTVPLGKIPGLFTCCQDGRANVPGGLAKVAPHSYQQSWTPSADTCPRFTTAFCEQCMPESSLRPLPISLCFNMLGFRLPSWKGIAADNAKFCKFYVPIGDIRVICGFSFRGMAGFRDCPRR
jgi:hypothetical protein